MDLSKNNQYNSRSETVEMGRKLHTAALDISKKASQYFKLDMPITIETSQGPFFGSRRSTY